MQTVITVVAHCRSDRMVEVYADGEKVRTITNDQSCSYLINGDEEVTIQEVDMPSCPA